MIPNVLPSIFDRLFASCFPIFDVLHNAQHDGDEEKNDYQDYEYGPLKYGS